MVMLNLLCEAFGKVCMRGTDCRMGDYRIIDGYGNHLLQPQLQPSNIRLE